MLSLRCPSGSDSAYAIASSSVLRAASLSPFEAKASAFPRKMPIFLGPYAFASARS